jgi:hypothetical protein
MTKEAPGFRGIGDLVAELEMIDDWILAPNEDSDGKRWRKF